jgi:hypothetical protein
MDERNEDLPERSGPHPGERVQSPHDQRDEMSQERDPSHPSGWSPARPYDKDGGKDGGKDDRVRDDGAHQRDRIRADVDSHLRRHQGDKL